MNDGPIGSCNLVFRIASFLIAAALSSARLLAATEQVALTGVVLDSQSKPVAGAEVFYVPGYTTPEISPTRSDGEGRFKLLVPDPSDRAQDERWGVLWAISSNHLLTRLWLANPKSPKAPPRLLLEPPGDFHLKVLDPYGKPVVGAKVKITHYFTGEDSPAAIPEGVFFSPPEVFLTRLTATTDRNGNATLPPVMWRWVNRFDIEHPEFGCQSLYWMNGEHAAEHVVRLCPIGRIEGHIVADKPEVVRGVKIRLLTEARGIIGRRPSAESTYEAISDKDGRFTTPPLAAGDLKIWLPEFQSGTVEKRDYLPANPFFGKLESGESQPIEIRLAPTVRMQGTVREFGTGRPRPNVKVFCLMTYRNEQGQWCQQNDSKTDAQGRFEFRELPGNAQVSLSHGEASQTCVCVGGGEILGSPRRVVDVSEGTKRCDIPPLDVALVRGRVVDETGKPVPAVNVHYLWRDKRHEPNGAERKHWEHETVPMVDEQGNFRVFADPGSQFRVWTESGDYRPTETDWTETPNQADVILPDIVLRSKHSLQGRTLVGRVVDRQGKSVIGAAIFLAAHSDETSTDGDGRFRLDGVPIKNVPIFVEKQGFRFHGQWVDPKADRLQIVLHRSDEPPERMLEGVSPHAMSRKQRQEIAARLLEPAVRRVLEDQSASAHSRGEQLLRSVGALAPQLARQLLAGKSIEDEQYRNALRAGLTESRRRWCWDMLEACIPFESARQALRLAAGSYCPRDLCFDPRDSLVTLVTVIRNAVGADDYLNDNSWLDFGDCLPPTLRGVRYVAYRQALRRARGFADPEDRLETLGCIAGRLLDCDHREEAAQVFQEGQELAKTLGDGWLVWTRMRFAKRLARLDPRAAVKMVEVMPADLRDGAMGMIAAIVAVDDPREAERLLGILRTRKHGNAATLCVHAVCSQMAVADLPRARRLADQIVDGSQKARAYAAMAAAIKSRQPDAVADLLREAYTVLDAQARAQGKVRDESSATTDTQREDSAENNLAVTAATILFLANQIAPSHIEEYSWRTLALRLPPPADGSFDENLTCLSPATEMDLQWCYLLAFHDRKSAQVVLADSLERLPKDKRALASSAAAFVDPTQAVAALENAAADVAVEQLAREAAISVVELGDLNCFDYEHLELPSDFSLDLLDSPTRHSTRGYDTLHDQMPGPDDPPDVVARIKAARPMPPRRYVLDGLFSDWKDYTTAWEETGSRGADVPKREVDVKQFYYDNDEEYLYLFFKCMPSVAERYQDDPNWGHFVKMHLDRGPQEGTNAPGAILKDSAKANQVEINVKLAAMSNPNICFVSYEVHGWDQVQKRLGRKIRKEESLHRRALIAHGLDGVEMALPLAELGLRPGQTAELTCRESWDEDDSRNNHCKIRLK